MEEDLHENPQRQSLSGCISWMRLKWRVYPTAESSSLWVRETIAGYDNVEHKLSA
jgi:hypothetical protein